MNLHDIKIEIPNPPTGEPESYCRFCYSAEKLVSIFPATGSPHQRIVDLLKQLTTIKLNVLDDFPSAICSQCLLKLEEFHRFRKQCLIYYDEVKRMRLGTKICAFLVSVKNEELPESSEDVIVRQEIREGTDADLERGELSSIVEIESIKIEPASEEVPQVKEPINETKQIFLPKTKRTRLVKRQQNKLETPDQQTNLKNRRLQPKDYRCRVCLKFFINKHDINSHLTCHTDPVKNKCLNCSKTFRTSQGLSVHMIMSYILTTFSCQHCDILFKSKDKLIKHESTCEQDEESCPTVEDSRSHQCDFCPKKFDTARQLYSHALLHGGKFTCDKCGANFHTFVNLKNHKKRYHEQGVDKISTIVKCEPCQRTFVDASAYRSHHTRIHQQDRDQQQRKLDENKPFVCDHCGKRFWSINTIRYHVLVHRQYRDCDHCSESFRSVKELKQHNLSAHPVKCEFCPKKYPTKKACRSHSNRMHGMIQIKILDKSGSVTYAWRKLVFQCAACEKDYETFNYLKDHYDKMHPGAKTNIKCSYCKKHTSSSRIGYVGHVNGNCGKTPKKLKAWH
ncbi:zinc finger protein 311-like [Armigeres subalbatus]|uniref:zinc finger protein 311-like n=1 Tax=Armigeres subalbatus TaxID=124917 RepID=UPI002ECFDCB1